MDSGSAPYHRIHAWGILVQSLETWAFSDHRGIMPSDVALPEGSLAARFTSSKTRGSDRDLTAHVVSCCFLARPSWPTLGRSLLVTFADVFGFTCCLIQRRTAAVVFSYVSAFRCSSEFCIYCGSVGCPCYRGAPLLSGRDTLRGLSYPVPRWLWECQESIWEDGVPKAVTDTVVWQGSHEIAKVSDQAVRILLLLRRRSRQRNVQAASRYSQRRLIHRNVKNILGAWLEILGHCRRMI